MEHDGNAKKYFKISSNLSLRDLFILTIDQLWILTRISIFTIGFPYYWKTDYSGTQGCWDPALRLVDTFGTHGFALIFNGEGFACINRELKKYLQFFVSKNITNVCYLCIRKHVYRISTSYEHFKSKNKMYSDFDMDFSQFQWLNRGQIDLQRKPYRKALISY